MPTNPWGGGGSSKKNQAKFSDALKNAIGAGDVASVKKLARRGGLSDQDRRAFVGVARDYGGNSFFDRLGSDLSGTLTGLPRGVAGLAAGVAKEAVAPAVIGYRGVSGQKVSTNDLIGSIPGLGFGYNTGRGFFDEKAQDDLHSLSLGTGQSFRRTGDRLTDPERAINDYSQHPFSTAVEDLGNVAVVGGAAARAARFAGLEKTASVLETGSRYAGNVANAPFLPVSPIARSANKVLLKGAERASESRLLHGVMKTIGQTPAQRATRAELSNMEHRSGEAANQAVKQIAQPLEKLMPRKAEQEALGTIQVGQDQALAKLRAQFGPEAVDRIVTEQPEKYGNISPAGAQLAADFADNVNPEWTSRVHQGLDIAETVSAEREIDQYLAEGTPESRQRQAKGSFEPDPAVIAEASRKARESLGPLDEQATRLRQQADEAKASLEALQAKEAAYVSRSKEMKTIGEFGPQLGPKGLIGSKDINAERAVARIQEASARRVEGASVRAKMLETRAAAAERRLARATDKIHNLEGNAAYSLEAAPARLRPVLEGNRAIRQEFVVQENALRAQGLHAQADALGAAGAEIPTTLAALEHAGVDPSHFIRTVDREPAAGTTFPQQFRETKTNAARRRTGRGQEVRSVRAFTAAEIRNTRRVIQNETVQKLEAMPFAKTAGEIVGRDMTAPTLEELRAAGYEPLDATRTIEVDSKVVPSAVADMTKKYFNDPKWDRVLQKVYDPITRGFKTMVLPLSPSWQVGNVIGNLFMGTLVAGIDPFTLGKNIVKGIVEYKRTGEMPGPQRLYETGSTYETLDYLRGGNLGAKGIRKLSPVRLGYEANRVVDDMLRAGVYLSKKGRGYSDEMALRQSLQAMGDFTNLSPFERRVIRRIIPFYAWQKHLTQMAVRMPVEHPLRTAWMLSLAQNFGQDPQAWEELLPGYMRGALDIGGGNVLETSNLFPFSSPVDWATDPRSALRNLSPQLKAIVENRFGISTLTGRPFTRPPGTGEQDESGNLLPTAPSLLEQLKQMSPQVRLGRNLSGYNNVARYQDGSVVKFKGDDGKYHTIPTGLSTENAILKWVGLNVRSKSSTKQIVDSILKKKIANWKTLHPATTTGKSSNPWGG